MSVSMIILIVVGILLLLLVFSLIGFYNGFVKLSQMVDESFATMDVYMKKRFDLIPNLVETVKGYANHEKETLERVIEARNSAMTSNNLEDRIDNENMLTGALRSLFALSENYPDLKANTSFLDLQNQLKEIEEDIANSRKYYNAIVREYNTNIKVFPKNLVAGIFGFRDKPMFSVDKEEERKAVKVSF